MGPRTLKFLAGVFLGLFALWLGLLCAQRSRRKNLFWPKAGEARRLVLGRAGAQATLVKDGSWRLETPFRFAADSPRVNDLLKKISQVELSEPLSTDPSKQELFQVNDSSAIRLKGFTEDAKAALDVWVGRQGADYDSFFVRDAGSAVVREARGLARYELDKEPGAWADATLCAADELKMASLEIRAGKSLRRFRRDNGQWFLGEDKKPLSSEKRIRELDPLLAVLANLKADSVAEESILDPAAVRGLKNPALSISIKTAQESVELAVGPESRDSKRLVRKKGVPGAVYLVADWKLKAFSINPGPAGRPSRPGR